ncbi:MAG: D-alanine--D-alanine ligase [Cyanobacteria bacterium J06649_4]
MTLRLLHLVGSPTDDFYCDLSKLYAEGCLEALGDLAGYDFTIAYITPDGCWRFPLSLQPVDIAAAMPMSCAEALQLLSVQSIDAALPQMFCLAGMTRYRMLLELLQIPCIGNGAFQMAIAADKAKTRAIVAAAGVAVPTGELLRPGEHPSISPVAVVKPNSADNSDGVTLVRQQKDYAAALETAFSYADEVIVEEFIELGREVRCGIVVSDGELICLPLEEYAVDAKLRPIREKVDKLKRNEENALIMTAKEKTQSWIVDLDDAVVEHVWQAAKKCHRALGCQQYSLFDFRIDPEGRPWFIEAGLYCSFSPQSVLVAMMAANNVPLAHFFESAVKQVLASHSDKETQRLKIDGHPSAVLSG